MFSVPGWNISATVATQVEKPAAQGPEKLGKKARKRKERREQEVTGENVGEVWERVVGGKDVKGVEKEEVGGEREEKRGKKRKRKGGKGEADVEAGTKMSEPKGEDDTAKPDNESKRDKKKHKKEHKKQFNSTPDLSQEVPSPAPLESLLPPEPKGLTPLQKSMRQKLAGARFRHLNETLYTKPSADSLALFKEDPSMFEDYHRGFAMQTEGWPENPVDGYVAAILMRGKVRDQRYGGKDKDKRRRDKDHKHTDAPSKEEDGSLQDGGVKPLPRNFKGHCTIADLGCGTASLSHRLQPHLKSLHLTLHSYDLSRPTGPSANLVTVADIANLPCADGSVDVAIFCLALMGTNWLDFIDEAWRVLRWRGELWVAEIKSRFGRVEKKSGKNKKPPINSIGSLRKGGGGSKASSNKKPADKDDSGDLASEDEAELSHRIDGVPPAHEGTDVSSFVAVLRAHGFVLDAAPEKPSAAIAMGNKMFVKMQFVKAAQPSKGKNVKESVNGLRVGMKGKKFAQVEQDDADDVDGGKVLKPCLYKIR